MKLSVNNLIDRARISGAFALLLLLVAADCGFVILHLVNRFTHLTDTPMLSLTRDRGYPEMYQYIKEFWIIILFIAIFLRSRIIGYCIWSLLFVYLLLDDAFKIHETVGGHLAIINGWSPMFGLRAKDFGEMAVSSVVATFFLISLWFPYARGEPIFKRVTKHMGIMIIALAFFGVIVDMIHILVPQEGVISTAFSVIEDGGEMLMISLITWYLYSFFENIKVDSIPSESRL